jgi:phosphohistidine phosphatase
MVFDGEEKVEVSNMTTLYLVRHARAHERDIRRYPDDMLRTLSEDGRLRFARLATKLSARKIRPRVIATSPAVRCMQTADLLAEKLRNAPLIQQLDALAAGASLSELIEWTRRQQVDEIAWVGHEPDMSEYLGRLIGAAGANIRFAKGAVAAVRFDDEIAIGAAELRWLVTTGIMRA